VELLRSYLQTEEALSGLELAERIRSVVLSRGPEFREAVTPLQALLDAPHDDPNWEALDPTDRRRRTIDAACGLLLAECRSEPLAVVFEDLHWVDEGTRLLLENLVDAIPRQPLLLLVNYRPEFVDPWIAREHHTLIKLDPLPAKAARELLDEIFGDDASLAPLKHMLVEVTGGNPLFLEESARTLIDKGSVVSAPGGELRLRGRVEELQIPPSVQSIIAARIDHRPAREKAVLQTAAVIGTQVPLSLLARLLGRPALEVRAALATLQAADFLHETEVFPEPEYRFKHVLIHDVAYNSLLKQQRRVLHGNIVKLIEELPPDQRIRHVELLADHALKAELWEKAVAYNRNAWRRAQARSLYREASVRAQLAIGAAENLPPVRENRETAVDLRFELRASLFPLAEFDTLDRRLEEALGIARSIADGPRENLALACLAVARWRAARFAEAMPLAESALRLLDQDAPDINRIMTHHSLGLASAALGRFSDARKWHGLVASSVEGNLLSREFDVSRHVALAHAFCAWYSLELGDEIEARRLSKEACSIADDLGQFYAVSHNQFVAALIAIRCGEYREAIARLGPHLERTTKDAASNLPWVASTLGWALVLAGDSMQGMQLLELAIDSSTRAVGLPYALPLINMAEAALALRALDRAGWAALTAREECLVRGEKGHETWALVLLAEIAAAQGNVPAAEGHYRVALQSAIDLKQESVVRRCRAGLTAFVNQKR
jgi:tetratricopeptide (TPR) repeat protein